MKPGRPKTAVQVQFEDGSAFLVARMSGEFSLQGMLAALERIAAESRSRAARRILVDISAVEGDIPDLDRFDIGRRGAEIFSHIERLGVLRDPRMRFTGFALDVAQNRGLDVHAFLERAEAVQWLTRD